MKQLILNKSTWVCGNNQKERGNSRLLNRQGFMCCLGQFTLQLHPEIPKKSLLSVRTPRDLRVTVDEFIKFDSGTIANNPLSQRAITINDSINTSIEQKIEQLTELFKEYNYEIIVKE